MPVLHWKLTVEYKKGQISKLKNCSRLKGEWKRLHRPEPLGTSLLSFFWVPDTRLSLVNRFFFVQHLNKHNKMRPNELHECSVSDCKNILFYVSLWRLWRTSGLNKSLSIMLLRLVIAFKSLFLQQLSLKPMTTMSLLICYISYPTKLNVSWPTQNLYSKYRMYRMINLWQNLKTSTNFSGDKLANKIIQTEGRQLYSNNYKGTHEPVKKKVLPIRIKIK